MHKALRAAIIAEVHRHIEEGDCPTKRSYDIETLENVIADLATQADDAERREGISDDAMLAVMADAIVMDVAELPDRTSPDDWPDAMLVTEDELRLIVTRQAEQLLPAQPRTTEARLREASLALQEDLLMRAELRDGTKVVNVSNGIWRRFCAALRQADGGE